MKLFLLFFMTSAWARSAIRLFTRLGVAGFFLLETLNSSFFYLPLANELLMLAHLREGKGWMWWALAVSMSAAGSVAGVALVDLPARKAGEKGLERFVSARRIEQLKRRLKSRAGWVVLLVSMLPPPFPFRPLMLTASALQTPRRVIWPAVFAGRLVRFAVEAALLIHFGRSLVGYMESDAFEYVLYVFGAVALIGTALTAYKWLGRGGETAKASGKNKRKDARKG